MWLMGLLVRSLWQVVKGCEVSRGRSTLWWEAGVRGHRPKGTPKVKVGFQVQDG